VSREPDSAVNMQKWSVFFAETVDEALKQIFKEDGAKAIYDFLEKHANIKPDEFADKPEIFSSALETLMVSAAQVVENVILKKLHSKMKVEFVEKQGYKFSDYVKELKGRD